MFTLPYFPRAHFAATAKDALFYPLDGKIKRTLMMIQWFYLVRNGMLSISYSGGKDSTVLLHLIRENLSTLNIPAVFCNTGVELPGVRRQGVCNADVIIKPDRTFSYCVDHYGFPVVSKLQSAAVYKYRHAKLERHKYYILNGFPRGNKGKLSNCWHFLIDAPFKISSMCCDYLKKKPMTNFEKTTKRSPMIGCLAVESNVRSLHYHKTGGVISTAVGGMRLWPIAHWGEDDIDEYVDRYKIKLASEYDCGMDRTGCAYCGFGLPRDGDPNRFILLKSISPNMYKYAVDKLRIRDIFDFVYKGSISV